MKFTLPNDMKEAVDKIMNGEYGIPISIKHPVSILDLGANIGAFTFWALQKWECTSINCYEPLSTNFELLEKNIERNELQNIVKLHNVAVGNTSLTKIYKGKTNCGEASLFKRGTTIDEYEEVTTISPLELPYADIVKIDTEGSEVDIISQIQFQPMVYLFEYHSEADRRTLDSLLQDYTLVGCDVPTFGCGVAKYIKTDFIRQKI